MKKNELVNEILKVADEYSKAELEAMNVKQLNKIYEDKSAVQEVKEDEVVPIKEIAPDIDLDALKADLMAELKAEALAQAKAEMLEQAKAEAKAELEAKVKEEAKVPQYRKNDLDMNRLVPVMNITSGSLIYRSKRTGAEFNFSEYGDVEYIEIQELLSMRTAQRKFYDVPFIYIMDEEVVEFMGLTKDYENIVLADQIDNIFKKTQDEFEKIVNNSPIGIKHSIVQRAKRLYIEGKLDSVKKVNFLNNTFGCEIGLRG